MARLLIVEDDPLLRETLVELFALAGLEAMGARDPGAACALLREQPVDLIVSDAFDGVWDPALPTLKPLQHAAGGAKLLLYTGHPEAENLRPADHGLSDIWIKPLKLNIMMSRVATLLPQADGFNTVRIE